MLRECLCRWRTNGGVWSHSAGRLGRQSAAHQQQPAGGRLADPDPRDDRAQRAHRLHHRQGRHQNRRDQASDFFIIFLCSLSVHILILRRFYCRRKMAQTIWFGPSVPLSFAGASFLQRRCRRTLLTFCFTLRSGGSAAASRHFYCDCFVAVENFLRLCASVFACTCCQEDEIDFNFTSGTCVRL